MKNESAWHSKIDNNKICWLTFDTPNKSANVLSEKVLIDLDKILDGLHLKTPKGLVFKSSKKTGFILGADINEFTNNHKFDDIYKATIFGQSIMNKIENLSCPTISLLNGFTLGGGLELAISCDYIISANTDKRCIGFPEVKLGLLPGFGGYVRGIEKMGALSALDLILSGRSVSPKEGLKLGLIDQVCNKENLESFASKVILNRQRIKKIKWYLKILNLKIFRKLIYLNIKKRISKKVNRNHYPAPYAILDLWNSHGIAKPKSYEASAIQFCNLYKTNSSRGLIRVFQLSDKLKSLGKKNSDIKTVHVIGGGTMGSDIASWCAFKGIQTSIQDKAISFLEAGLSRAEKLFRKRIKNEEDFKKASSRLSVDLDGKNIGSSKIIIEAITEDLETKRGLFKKLESKSSSNTILATNTSSIKIEDIADTIDNPERIVGIHFFNPVHSLPLVEVVEGKKTSKETIDKAISFVTQIGKLPLPCKSSPGFVVNRILAPYMNQALLCYMDGFSPETIDQAAKNFGMPTGPIELADRVGLDIALHVVKVFGGQPPDILKTKVLAGHLGAKTGMGFYKFKNNRPEKSSSFDKPDSLLTDRLMYSLINEAMSCFDDGVVDDIDLIDAAVIFGTGFAPFTGGPLNYAKQIGLKSVLDKLKSLEQSFGTSFKASSGWSNLS